MKHTKKLQVHPYDIARDSLKETSGGLFGVTFNTPIQNGHTLAPWRGDAVTSFRFTPMRLLGNYYTVHFLSGNSDNALWFVNLKGDTTQEARNRLAEVFMDLINTQRIQ